MRKAQLIFIVIVLTIYSCKNENVESKIDSEKTFSNPIKIENVESKEEDTITDIQFKEFSLSINRLLIYDENKELDKMQKDSVYIYAELGESIENQKIKIVSNQIESVSVEQRYQTSVTIGNEGPHCDLTEWKHFYSDWKELKKDSFGEFICYKYSPKESQQFPDVDIEELKQKFKSECGNEFPEIISKISKPTESPCEVGISRYYLRITGNRKDNGKAIVKIIVIEIQMGC